jgi:hypothetical protein
VFYYMPYYKGIWMGGNIPDTNLGTRPSWVFPGIKWN